MKRRVAGLVGILSIGAGIAYFAISSASSASRPTQAPVSAPRDVGPRQTQAGTIPDRPTPNKAVKTDRPELTTHRYSVDRNDKGHAYIKERKQVRANWDNFVREAKPDDKQKQQLLEILSDMQQQYIAYQHGVNEAMHDALLTHDPKKVDEEADNLQFRDFDLSVEAEIRSRARKVLNPTQFGLFRRWSLDQPAGLPWGVYQRPVQSE